MDGKLIIEVDIKARSALYDQEDYDAFMEKNPDKEYDDWPQKVLYTKEQIEQMVFQFLESKIETALEEFKEDQNGDIVDMLQCDNGEYDAKDLVEIKTELIQK
jgi:hypothetical protein